MSKNQQLSDTAGEGINKQNFLREEEGRKKCWSCPSAERAGVAPVAMTEQNTATACGRGAVRAAMVGQTEREG